MGHNPHHAPLAQQADAVDLKSIFCGFESREGYSSARRILHIFSSPRPCGGRAPIAQLAEQLICNQQVECSSHSGSFCPSGGMEYAADLGSVCCGFESHGGYFLSKKRDFPFSFPGLCRVCVCSSDGRATGF